MADKVRVLVNGEGFVVTVRDRTRSSVSFEIDGRAYQVEIAADVQSDQRSDTGANIPCPQKALSGAPPVPDLASVGSVLITAPIPGVVVEVLVSVDDMVEVGMVVARLEAMKMQNNILAKSAGRVASIFVAPGDEVADAQPLLELHGG